MLRLKICVSAGAIIGAAILKNWALIWSNPVDLYIYIYINEYVDYIKSYIGYREMLIVKFSLYVVYCVRDIYFLSPRTKYI